jgi:hypothetical protein
VAYAEKRGKGPQPWRVKYKLPGGMEDSESGFKTKAAALAWGRDQEARIREGRWADPNAGNIAVSEWIDRWLSMQDVGISTENNREYLIRRYLRPAWGSSPLNSLSTELITRWENGLPARTGISRRTARDARSLLCTILGDAAAAKPPLIPYNPALRPRNRGRRTGRRLDRGPQRVWATPLQALLVAERAALLSGRDEDFTMVLTMGYTGLRWGETIGLELDFARPSEIQVEWQLREVNGRFYRLPPKDDSYRSTSWEPCLPVDLPGFLADLIASQIDAGPRQKCACVGQHGGSGPVRLPRPRRRPLPAQQLRPPRVPPGLRRTARISTRPRPADHRRRHGLARRPGRRLAARPAGREPQRGRWPRCGHRRRQPGCRCLRAAARPWNRGRPGGHPARLLASGQTGTNAARAQAQPQDMDGRGRHPGDPRRAAARARGARHARPLRPRLGADARRAEGRAPGPLGRLARRTRGHPPALARAAARSTPGTVQRRNQSFRRPADTPRESKGASHTGGQGEDDLPNSSQI